MDRFDRAIEFLGHSLQSGYANERQRSLEEREMRRQAEMDERMRRQDRESLINKAHGLYGVGRGSEAVALLRQAGIGAQDVAEMMDIPGVSTADIPAIQRPATGGSAIPDQLDRGRSMPTQELQTRDPEAAAMTVDPTPPRGQDLENLMQTALAERRQGAQEDPRIVANEFGKAKQAQRLRNRLRITMPEGGTFDIDPEAERDTRLTQFDETFKGSQDPTIAKYYGQIRPVLAASNQDVDPTDLFKFLQSKAAEEERAKREEARLIAADKREEVRNLEWDRRFGITEPGREQRSIRAASARGQQVEQSAGRLELSKGAAARQIVKDTFANTGFKEEQAKHRKFNDMASMLSQKNPAADSVAAGSFVKMAQGGTGVISDNDMEQFWNRIGGVKDRSAQWVENVLSGTIVDPKRQKVSEAVQWLAGQAQTNLSGIKEALRFNLQNSEVPEATDRMIGTYFPEERQKIIDAGKSGTVKSNQLTDAAAVSKFSPADKKLADMALKRLAANPNDTSALEWLKEHGLR